MWRTFASELTDASGIDVGYNDEGTLFVVLEGEDEEKVTSWVNWQFEAGLRLERLTADELRGMEPAVTDSATRAIFLPDEHQVDNRRVMDALEIAIKQAGVELIEGAEVTALTTDKGKVAGVVAGGQRLDAGTTIVAAGTWSSPLLKPLGLEVRVVPVRGQMIAVKGETNPITRVLHSSGVYLVPRRDGRILIGATVESAGFRKSVTAAGLRSLLEAGLGLAPGLEGFDVIESWAGLRPDTEDHKPVIGATGIPNLLLATGHFRNGILLAPVTAELLTRIVTSDGHVPDELRPFEIERFLRREHSTQGKSD
jgi:glycine oxidase